MYKVRKSNGSINQRVFMELEFKPRDGITLSSLRSKLEEYHPDIYLETEHGGMYEISLRYPECRMYYNTNVLIEKWIAIQEDLRPFAKEPTPSCGLHLHIDVSEYDPIQISNIYNQFYEFQKVYQLIIPSSRWMDNVNCKEVNYSLAHRVWENAKLYKTGQISSDEFRRNISGMKFYGLSTNRLVDFGTLEWRWNQFTIDQHKLANTIKYHINLTNYWAGMVNNRWARFKGLKKPYTGNLYNRISVDVDEFAKPNRFTKGNRIPKDIYWSWMQVFGYGSENTELRDWCESRTRKLGNHGIGKNSDCMLKGISDAYGERLGNTRV